MKIRQHEFAHPTQASRVRLNLFRVQDDPSPVYGLNTVRKEAPFLLTEDRVGVTTVVATLGAFATEQEADAVLQRRAVELERQSYRLLAATSK